MLDKSYRVGPAAQHLGEEWKKIHRYFSTAQKKVLDEISSKYGKNKKRRVLVRTYPKSVKTGTVNIG